MISYKSPSQEGAQAGVKLIYQARRLLVGLLVHETLIIQEGRPPEPFTHSDLQLPVNISFSPQDIIEDAKGKQSLQGLSGSECEATDSRTRAGWGLGVGHAQPPAE